MQKLQVEHPDVISLSYLTEKKELINLDKILHMLRWKFYKSISAKIFEC